MIEFFIGLLILMMIGVTWVFIQSYRDSVKHELYKCHSSEEYKEYREILRDIIRNY